MATGSFESPLDDLTYDVITVLQRKAQALEAYDKYIEDAEEDQELRELFVEMRRQEEANIRILKEALARRLDDELGFDDDEEDDDFIDDDDDEEDDEDDYDDLNEDRSMAGDDLEAPPSRGESTPRRS